MNKQVVANLTSRYISLIIAYFPSFASQPSQSRMRLILLYRLFEVHMSGEEVDSKPPTLTEVINDLSVCVPDAELSVCSIGVSSSCFWPCSVVF